jgi:hypothetical protein
VGKIATQGEEAFRSLACDLAHAATTKESAWAKSRANPANAINIERAILPTLRTKRFAHPA